MVKLKLSSMLKLKNSANMSVPFDVHQDSQGNGDLSNCSLPYFACQFRDGQRVPLNLFGSDSALGGLPFDVGICSFLEFDVKIIGGDLEGRRLKFNLAIVLINFFLICCFGFGYFCFDCCSYFFYCD